MKTVINQKVSYEANAYNPMTGAVVFDDNGEEVTKLIETTYANLIKDCVRHPSNPQSGFSYEEIDHTTDIKLAIKAEQDGEIKFEEATFKYIVQRVKEMKWGVASPEFTKFKNYIISVSEAKPKKDETVKAD